MWCQSPRRDTFNIKLDPKASGADEEWLQSKVKEVEGAYEERGERNGRKMYVKEGGQCVYWQGNCWWIGDGLGSTTAWAEVDSKQIPTNGWYTSWGFGYSLATGGWTSCLPVLVSKQADPTPPLTPTPTSPLFPPRELHEESRSSPLISMGRVELETAFVQLERAFQEQGEELEKLRSQAQQLERLRAETSEFQKQRIVELQSRNSQVSALEKEIAKLQVELAKAALNSSSQRSTPADIQIYSDRIKQLEEKNDELQGQLIRAKNLEGDLALQTERCKRVEEENSRLLDQLRNRSSKPEEHDSLRERITALESELAQAQVSEKEHQLAAANDAARVDRLEAQRVNASKLEVAYTAKIAELEAQLEATSAQQNDTRGAQGELETLEKRSRELEAESAALQARLSEQAKAQLQVLQEQVAAAEARNQDLEVQKQAVEAKLKTHLKASQNNETVIKALRDRVAELQAESEQASKAPLVLPATSPSLQAPVSPSAATSPSANITNGYIEDGKRRPEAQNLPFSTGSWVASPRSTSTASGVVSPSFRMRSPRSPHGSAVIPQMAQTQSQTRLHDLTDSQKRRVLKTRAATGEVSPTMQRTLTSQSQQDFPVSPTASGQLYSWAEAPASAPQRSQHIVQVQVPSVTTTVVHASSKVVPTSSIGVVRPATSRGISPRR